MRARRPPCPVARGERLRGPCDETAQQHRAAEEDHAGKQAHPVKNTERVADERSGHVARGRDGKGGWGFDEGQKDDSADPDDEGEEHQETENGHDGSSQFSQMHRAGFGCLRLCSSVTDRVTTDLPVSHWRLSYEAIISRPGRLAEGDEAGNPDLSRYEGVFRSRSDTVFRTNCGEPPYRYPAILLRARHDFPPRNFIVS